MRNIAEDKMQDLNAFTVESAMKMVAGTARSMGLTVKVKLLFNHQLKYNGKNFQKRKEALSKIDRAACIPWQMLHRWLKR